MRFAAPDRVIAPYITKWDAEQDLRPTLVMRPDGGIGYADELLDDRDDHGVLWQQTAARHGVGRPAFGEVHPWRQRRAMIELLCQVCAGPADRTRDGVLWLLRDYQGDWPGWPERMGSVEPPCLRALRRELVAALSGTSAGCCRGSSSRVSGRGRARHVVPAGRVRTERGRYRESSVRRFERALDGRGCSDPRAEGLHPHAARGTSRVETEMPKGPARRSEPGLSEQSGGGLRSPCHRRPVRTEQRSSPACPRRQPQSSGTARRWTRRSAARNA